MTALVHVNPDSLSMFFFLTAFACKNNSFLSNKFNRRPEIFFSFLLNRVVYKKHNFSLSHLRHSSLPCLKYWQHTHHIDQYHTHLHQSYAHNFFLTVIGLCTKFNRGYFLRSLPKQCLASAADMAANPLNLMANSSVGGWLQNLARPPAAHGYSRCNTFWRDGKCPALACCWCWRGSRWAGRRRGGDSIASGRAPAALPETQMTRRAIG